MGIVVVSASHAHAAVAARILSRGETGHDTAATAVGCPYDFASEMPPATFCVYNGVALDDGGAVCAKNVVIIWSSYTAQPSAYAADGSTGRELYVGFVTAPDLVLRGVVTAQDPDTARLAALNDAEHAETVGQMRLRTVQQKSDVVSMDIRGAHHLSREDCSVTSYAGTFVGLIRPSADSTAIADELIPAEQ